MVCAAWDVCFVVDELGQTPLDGSTPDNQALQDTTDEVQLDRQHDGYVRVVSLFQGVEGILAEYGFDSLGRLSYRL